MSLASELKDANTSFTGVRKQVDNAHQKRLDDARNAYYEARSGLYGGKPQEMGDLGTDVQALAGGGVVQDPDDPDGPDPIITADTGDVGLPPRPVAPAARTAPAPAPAPTRQALPVDTPMKDSQTQMMIARGGNPAKPQAAVQGQQAQPAEFDHHDGVLGMALHGALTTIQRAFGLDQSHGADAPAAPQAAIGPAPVKAGSAKGLMLLANHAGAMSPEEFQQVRQIVDPENKLNDQLKNVAGLNSLYEYYLQKGDIMGANKAAASMVQTLSMVSSRLGAQAEDAIKSGKFPQAAEILQKAYDFVPDGNSVDAQANPDGSGQITMRDSKGKVTFKGNFTPQDLLNAATGMKNGSLFWKQLTSSAARYLGPNTGADDDPNFGNAIAAIDTEGNPSGAAATPAPAAAGTPTAGANPPAGVVAPATPAAAGPPETPTVPATPAGAPGATPQEVGPELATGKPTGDDFKKAWTPPQTVVRVGTDTPMPVAPEPVERPDPNGFKPFAGDPAVLQEYADDPKKLRAYQAAVKEHNRQKALVFNEGVKAYKDYVKEQKEYDSKAKAAEWKPGVTRIVSTDSEAITQKITDHLMEVGDMSPTSGGFKDEAEVKKFYGRAADDINDLAHALYRDNPNLTVPDAAARTAIGLVFDPNQPGMPPFKPLGYTPGGKGVVIEAANGEQVVLDTQMYKRVLGVNKYLSDKTAKAEEATVADAEKTKKLKVAGGNLGAAMLEKAFRMVPGVQSALDTRKALDEPAKRGIPGQHPQTRNGPMSTPIPIRPEGFALEDPSAPYAPRQAAIPDAPQPPRAPYVPQVAGAIPDVGPSGADAPPIGRAGMGGSSLIENILQQVTAGANRARTPQVASPIPPVGPSGADAPAAIPPEPAAYVGRPGPARGYVATGIPDPGAGGAAQPPIANPNAKPAGFPYARLAPDGHWYIPNPAKATHHNEPAWVRVK